MLLLAADENFNNDIVRGLLRRRPALDIVRIQDEGLSGQMIWLFLNGRHGKDVSSSPMMFPQLPIMPMIEFERVGLCSVSLK